MVSEAVVVTWLRMDDLLEDTNAVSEVTSLHISPVLSLSLSLSLSFRGGLDLGSWIWSSFWFWFCI
jgi:hypothetical protein